LLNYFARERLQLNEDILNDVLERFRNAVPTWWQLLDRSFLSAPMKEKFAAILSERVERLQL
jgi:serine/threonine-protein kinase HipA